MIVFDLILDEIDFFQNIFQTTASFEKSKKIFLSENFIFKEKKMF